MLSFCVGVTGWGCALRGDSMPAARRSELAGFLSESTALGVYARVAARLSALAAAIWHNWHIDTPRKRSLIAFDHRDIGGALGADGHGDV